MLLKTKLAIDLHELGMSTQELVFQHLPPEAYTEYLRLERLALLYMAALEEGWKEFDWTRANSEGWLCTRDFRDFPEQTAGLDPEEYLKARCPNLFSEID